jgi:hypothetical protein
VDRADILDHIKSARHAHQKWVESARALVSDITVEKNDIPVKHTECHFGRWFYSEGVKLAQLDKLNYIEQIDKKHQELHEEYKKIYNIYFAHDDRSFFGKLFNTKPTIFYSDEQLAKRSFQNLQEISKDLLNLLELLEKHIALLPRAALDAIN